MRPVAVLSEQMIPVIRPGSVSLSVCAVGPGPAQTGYFPRCPRLNDQRLDLVHRQSAPWISHFSIMRVFNTIDPVHNREIAISPLNFLWPLLANHD